MKTWIATLSYSEMQYLAIDTNSGLTIEQTEAINAELAERMDIK